MRSAGDAEMGSPRKGASVFDRIVVGVDGTEAAFDACRQIDRLARRDAAIEVAAVVHLGPAVAVAVAGQTDATAVADRLQLEADEALAHAAEIVGRGAEKRFLNGFVTSALLDELEHFDATLLAVGAHGHHRAAEIVLGGAAGELLHRAPCSVLLARPAAAEEFPHRIVVGHDGSQPAADALEVAQELAGRHRSSLSVVVASGGHDAAYPPTAKPVEGHPVPVLLDAARDADLLVVGSRGLHGLRALGSVSERVAHQADCSVLVVRNLAHADENRASSRGEPRTSRRT